MGNFYQNSDLRQWIIHLLIGYMALIFLPFAVSNIVFVVLCLLTIYGLFNGIINLKNIKIFSLEYVLIILPFLLTLLSVLHSKEPKYGLPFVWMRLPILLFPFVFLLIQPKMDEMKKGFWLLIILNLWGIIYSIFKLIRAYPNDFYYLNPDQVKGTTIIQHSYLGIISLISIVLVLHVYKQWGIARKYLFFIIPILTLGIIISTSKLAYILGFIYLVVQLSQKLSLLKSLFLSLIIAAIAGLVIRSNQGLAQKFSSEPRILLWENSRLAVINSHNLLGIGIGDYYIHKQEASELKGIRDNLGVNFRGVYGFETHNLFLEFLLLNGVLGLLFVISTIYSFYLILKSKNKLSIILFIILAGFMTTETLINRQWGIILYVFLMSFSFYTAKKNIQQTD